MATRERQFFVGQDYLGSAPAPDEWVHNELHTPIGQAFFCPLCATLWATVLVQGQATTVRHRPCALHKPGDARGTNSLARVFNGDIPGSLYLSESKSWNESLPDKVVAREFLITVAWAAHAPQLPAGVASMAQDVHNILNQQRRSK